MLKIKDNVDLKELEKYGYKKNNIRLLRDFWISPFPCSYDGYAKRVGKNKHGTRYAVLIETDRTISLYGISNITETRYKENDQAIQYYIKDLIKADLVEKVGD